MRSFLRGLPVAVAALCALTSTSIAQTITVKDGNSANQTIGASKPGSASYLTSGPITFTGTASVTALAAGVGLYDYVADLDCSSPGSAPVTITLLNSLSQALWSLTFQGGVVRPFATWIGGKNQVAANSAISIAAGGPAFAGTNVGTATIAASGSSYNSTTGVVSLTLTASSPFIAPETMVISGLTGTGSFASLDGTFTATSVSGTTVTYQGPTGLGSVTITGGSLAYSPSVTCNVQGYAWGS